VIQKCLAKHPEERWQSAADIKHELEWVAQGSTEMKAASPPVPKSIWKLALAWMLSTAAVVTLASFYANPSAQRRIVRSDLKAMPDSSFLLVGQPSGFTLSPDGTQLAYVAQNAGGKAMLWLRRLDSSQGKMLDGTEDSTYPFWSADSKNLGFFSGGKLKRVAAAGGPTLTLCDAPSSRGGTWSSQGVIVFAPSMYTGLFQVPATGGDPTALTTPDPNKGETSHRWPEFLPDGEHFIFLAGTAFVPKDAPSGYLRVGRLHSSESKPLIQSHANGFYASGHLLFLRGNTLMAQPFSPKKLQLFGDPVPIADPVYEDVTFLKSMASASQEGTLVYLDAFSPRLLPPRTRNLESRELHSTAGIPCKMSGIVRQAY
jgi:hypothetical protein